jgi:hypothetical protein
MFNPENNPALEREIKKIFSTERLREFIAMKEYAWEKARDLVEEYRQVLSADNGDFMRDISLLPASKEKIGKALAVYVGFGPTDQTEKVKEELKEQIFKEYFSQCFFGEKMEFCDLKWNHLFDLRKYCAGNSDAIQKIESIHSKDEELRNDYLEGEESGDFERRENLLRGGLADQFGALVEYPKPITNHLLEFSDKKWPDDLASDWVRAVENFQRSNSQSSGCLSLLIIAAIPTAIYVTAQMIS